MGRHEADRKALLESLGPGCRFAALQEVYLPTARLGQGEAEDWGTHVAYLAPRGVTRRAQPAVVIDRSLAGQVVWKWLSVWGF